MTKLCTTAPLFEDVKEISCPAGTANWLGWNWKSVMVTSMVVLGPPTPPHETSSRLRRTAIINIRFIHYS
jgi:hypothetical protein